MVNVMLLDFHVSSFFVHSFDPKKKKKRKNTLCKMKKKKKKKKKHAKLMHENMQ